MEDARRVDTHPARREEYVHIRHDIVHLAQHQHNRRINSLQNPNLTIPTIHPGSSPQPPQRLSRRQTKPLSPSSSKIEMCGTGLHLHASSSAAALFHARRSKDCDIAARTPLSSSCYERVCILVCLCRVSDPPESARQQGKYEAAKPSSSLAGCFEGRRNWRCDHRSVAGIACPDM